MNFLNYNTLNRHCVIFPFFSRRMNAELEAKTSELVKEAEELLVNLLYCTSLYTCIV